MYFVVIPAKVKSVVNDIPGEVLTQKLVSNHTEAKVKVPNRTNSRNHDDARTRVPSQFMEEAQKLRDARSALKEADANRLNHNRYNSNT